MGGRKRVIITMERTNSRFGDIFQDDIMEDSSAYADVVLSDLDRKLTVEELVERSSHVDAIITGWGSPRVDMTVVISAPTLRVIAHSAGA
jgi:hypothetical protein